MKCKIVCSDYFNFKTLSHEKLYSRAHLGVIRKSCEIDILIFNPFALILRNLVRKLITQYLPSFHVSCSCNFGVNFAMY